MGAVYTGMTTPNTPVDESTPVVDPTPDVDPSTAPVADADTHTDPTPDTDAAPDDAVAEAVKKATSKANREAQNLRKRLKELEDAEQARKDAELSETERLQNQLAEASANATRATEAAQRAAIRAAVAIEASKLNIIDPDAAIALMDSTGIEHAEDGTVTGVDKALAKLVNDKPYLVATPGNPRLDANNGGRKGSPDLTPQQQTQNLWARPASASIWNIPTP